MNEEFEIAGIRQPVQAALPHKQKWYAGKPLFSIAFLGILLFCCLACELIMTKDPVYMDLQHSSTAPDREFLFGTDTMGRDIFSMIWYGGRISLGIGISAAFISAAAAIVCGAVSGIVPDWADALLMRLTDILLSVPSLLIVIFLQAVLGGADVWRISLVLGLTSWMGMARIIRTEVRQMRNNEYVTAVRCMGGGFFYLLWKHLVPNFIPSIMFMAVMNIRNAMIAESTLSFMGIGLPLEVVSWGSMLSLSEKALLTGSWWIILVPGAFLIAALVCITNLGNYLRKYFNRGQYAIL